jgi:hypothetical protein
VARLASLLALTAVVLVAASLPAAAFPSRALETCAPYPAPGAPLWVEYGDISTPPEVRAVFGRPGVTVAGSNPGVAAAYREKGARSAYFVLKLPALVGSPTSPTPPEKIEALANRTFDRAVTATGCDRPWIAFNELAGPSNPVPWADSVRGYRQNILELLEIVAERGGTPVLLVHGNPVYTGEAATWWRAIGAAGHVVYEAYYKAPGIVARGRIVGPRRLRLGMRSVMRAFAATGIPRSRLGLMLGFQVAPGKFGREGLQPSSDWFRYVKWNALAARQVAQDERLASIWSWGWGNLSPQASDPDKPAAACVYLWARDQSLCDGRGAAGPDFKASLVEGPIVMADTLQCISIAGKLPRAVVAEHAVFLGNLDHAVSAAFARQVLRRKIPIARAEVDVALAEVVSRAFLGSRTAFLTDLKARRATEEIARGILEDAIRRTKIEALVGSQGVLPYVADAVTAALETATCRGDRLPGRGNFPQTDRRESSGVPLGAALPYLLADAQPPEAPAAIVATRAGAAVTLDWDDALAADTLGFVVYRSPAPGAAFTPLTTQPWPRSGWNDPAAPLGSSYRVVAIDAAGNTSEPSPPVAPPMRAS